MAQMRVLENEKLKIQVSDDGAELCSVYDKVRGREALWTADPKYWARHAPVLFPFVGKVNGGHYTYEGKQYPMGQHGFARDREFACVETGEAHVTHRLKSDEESKKVYPFDFVLEVTHRIEGNRVTVEWKVENPGDKRLYFSIGGHPGFCVTKQEGCTLIFDGQESLERVSINLEAAAVDAEHPETLKLTDGTYPVDAHTFDKGTVTKEATTTSAGTIEYKCTVCGRVKQEQIPILPSPQHEHKWNSAWTYDSTHHWHECTASGCTLSSNADKYGYAAHSFGAWRTVKAATATTDGLMEHQCSCGYKEKLFAFKERSGTSNHLSVSVSAPASLRANSIFSGLERKREAAGASRAARAKDSRQARLCSSSSAEFRILSLSLIIPNGIPVDRDSRKSSLALSGVTPEAAAASKAS